MLSYTEEMIKYYKELIAKDGQKADQSQVRKEDKKKKNKDGQV